MSRLAFGLLFTLLGIGITSALFIVLDRCCR
jgi:hypothetical protein